MLARPFGHRPPSPRSAASAKTTDVVRDPNNNLAGWLSLLRLSLMSARRLRSFSLSATRPQTHSPPRSHLRNLSSPERPTSVQLDASAICRCAIELPGASTPNVRLLCIHLVSDHTSPKSPALHSLSRTTRSLCYTTCAISSVRTGKTHVDR